MFKNNFTIEYIINKKAKEHNTVNKIIYNGI